MPPDPESSGLESRVDRQLTCWVRLRVLLTHHIGGQLVAGQIFHVFVVCVDDLCELAAVHHLFKHPHVDRRVKVVVFGSVGSHNLSNGRAPVYTDAKMNPYISKKKRKICNSTLNPNHRGSNLALNSCSTLAETLAPIPVRTQVFRWPWWWFCPDQTAWPQAFFET